MSFSMYMQRPKIVANVVWSMALVYIYMFFFSYGQKAILIIAQQLVDSLCQPIKEL